MEGGERERERERKRERDASCLDCCISSGGREEYEVVGVGMEGQKAHQSPGSPQVMCTVLLDTVPHLDTRAGPWT